MNLSSHQASNHTHTQDVTMQQLSDGVWGAPSVTVF